MKSGIKIHSNANRNFILSQHEQRINVQSNVNFFFTILCLEYHASIFLFCNRILIEVERTTLCMIHIVLCTMGNNAC